MYDPAAGDEAPVIAAGEGENIGGDELGATVVASSSSSSISPLSRQAVLPPPAPPLPPTRFGQLQRIIAPLGLNLGQRQRNSPTPRLGDSGVRNITNLRDFRPPPSQTAAHRTGIPITALDINKQKTHAILAGREILKTVRVQEGKVTEDFNLRSSISSYASTYGSPQAETSSRRREYLSARDVKWSTGKFDHIIATAGNSGRIALYDVNAAGSRTELAWLHEHTGQVNKLDFDPFAGYLLLSASQDKSVRLWDIREPRTVKCRQRFEVRNGVRDVRWSPAESLEFAVCADGGVIQKWDARNPLGPKLSINGHDRACYAIDWHPDGRHLISGGYDKYIRVWDFQSDNRRQKPAFQLKAPQAIKNIRWRPACWSSEVAESGQWQTSQIATSYHLDDPRIHIWDLRRPLVPFRELDRYNSPANGLLWASKDLLWTVGDEGMFTQTDVTFAPLLHNDLPPCAVQWTPDGNCLIFAEDRTTRHGLGPQDPAIGFLNVPEEKISGEDITISRSLTDDETMLDGMMSSRSKRRQVKTTSSISNKSQTNTPPTNDQPPVLSLDKAVLNRSGLFINDQVGMTGMLPGFAADMEVIKILASNYERPITSQERKASPQTILQRLELTFQRNADICDAVSMHRVAQSWRILGAVIVPELREWADQNRCRRKSEATEKKARPTLSASTKHASTATSLNKSSGFDVTSKSDGKRRNIPSSLFKAASDLQRGKSTTHELDNISDMTTPMARPLPESPYTDRKQTDIIGTDETIDNLPPLPPSVLISHSTASSASRALFETSSTTSDTPPSSPEKQRRIETHMADGQRRNQDRTRRLLNPSPQSTKSSPQPIQKHSKNARAPKSELPQPQRQEDRRAALRDYRVQARPIFSLDEPVSKSRYQMGERHDSADSFQMFSASTDSSHQGQYMGLSLESQRGHGRSSITQNSWREDQDSICSDFEISNPPSGEFDIQRSPEIGTRAEPEVFPTSETLPNFGLDGTTDFNLGLDGASSSKATFDKLTEADSWQVPNHKVSVPNQSSSETTSTSPELFHFETLDSSRRPLIHSVNPLRGLNLDPLNIGSRPEPMKGKDSDIMDEDMTSQHYLHHDFRPIDLSTYEPRSPFAWSSLPLICHAIAFDLDNGIAHGQFSAHLLMHVAPFFFHQDVRRTRTAKISSPETLVERLMRPDYSHRVIASIFEKHASFLKQIELYDSMAELKKVCLELDFPEVCSPSGNEVGPGTSLAPPDVYLLSVACSRCGNSMIAGQDVCDRCRHTQSICPICLSLRRNNDGVFGDDFCGVLKTFGQSLNESRLWAVCQSCGHGGHANCLSEWFTESISDGACPSPGCGCDCGPGTVRQQRIERQIREEDEARLIRGVGSGLTTNKDPVKVRPSPAVDKTRAVLRGWSDERISVSGDERGWSARRVSSRGRAGDNVSQRKSVRLVTPGEETRKTGRSSHPHADDEINGSGDGQDRRLSRASSRV